MRHLNTHRSAVKHSPMVGFSLTRFSRQAQEHRRPRPNVTQMNHYFYNNNNNNNNNNKSTGKNGWKNRNHPASEIRHRRY